MSLENTQLDCIKRSRLSTKKEILNRAEMARAYLDGSLHSKFDLEKLAEAVALSKFHLIRCFKEVYKITPQKYFICEKIKLSKSLLRDKSVSEVSQVLGYRDIHSFSRQFKAITGIPPSMLYANELVVKMTS